MKLSCPAKLNLGLRVLERRADGYHNLQTVFQLVDLCDQLQLRRRTDGEVRLEVTGADAVPSGEDNLVLRAARALQQAGGKKHGADLHLDKQIPPGAGLGGGSSDAAAALVGLNRLWSLQLPPARLFALANQLGADVPFFLLGCNAWAGGTGDELTPVCLPLRHYVLAVPNETLSTAKMFARLPAERAQVLPGRPCDYLAACEPGRAVNDFLSVALDCSEPVQRLYRRMEQWGQPQLTGTGSGLFLAFDCPAVAQRSANSLRSAYSLKGSDSLRSADSLKGSDSLKGTDSLSGDCRVYLLRTLHHSPLYRDAPESGKPVSGEGKI